MAGVARRLPAGHPEKNAMRERGCRVCHSGRRRQHGPPQQRYTVPREALVDMGSSLTCSALSHGHPDMATVAARRTPSGLDLSRPPAKTHSRRAPEAGATGSASRSLAARARVGPLPPFSREGVPPAAAALPAKEWLPLPPPLPRWRQVGPPPCAGRLCSSPPHPHRLWPHLHVEPLRWGAPPLCLHTLAMPS